MSVSSQCLRARRLPIDREVEATPLPKTSDLSRRRRRRVLRALGDNGGYSQEALALMTHNRSNDL